MADAVTYPCCMDDGYPFEVHSEFTPTYPQGLKCRCGSDTFRVHEPKFVVTVATCTQCGKSGVVHEG